MTTKNEKFDHSNKKYNKINNTRCNMKYSITPASERTTTTGATTIDISTSKTNAISKKIMTCRSNTKTYRITPPHILEGTERIKLTGEYQIILKQTKSEALKFDIHEQAAPTVARATRIQHN
jgi:hypothetical protein